jgi:hypothetical protein
MTRVTYNPRAMFDRLQAWVQLGTDGLDDDYDVQRVRITNFLSLLLIALGSAYVAILGLLHSTTLGATVVGV